MPSVKLEIKLPKCKKFNTQHIRLVNLNISSDKLNICYYFDHKTLVLKL